MKFLQSLEYAFRGIGYAISGRNFKIQIACAVLAIAAGLHFKISTIEWLVIALSIGGVLSAEMVNTAIERLADFIHPQKNDQIGKIKDIAAGAVLVLAITSLIVALIVFLPKALRLWQ